ncbi:MAG TPA: Dyp-type peroxidase [Actinomycetes bacterium]
MTTRLELDDMQGLLARGYGSLPYATFLLLGIDDAAAARSLLARWADVLTDAAARPADDAVNVALTADGIAALSPGRGIPAGFSEQFASGMTTAYRSRLLGDLDDDDPRGWRWGGPTTAPVHVMVLVFARTEELLADRCGRLADQAAGHGLSVVDRLETGRLGLTEPFGFHDGISQPPLEGLGSGDGRGDPVRAGEFVLGYPNEHDQLTARPLLPVADDPRSLLARDHATGLADLGRNGSYLVVRQLRQDVEAFWSFTEAATRTPDGRPDAAASQQLAAKMMGRWPGGAPLVLAPERDDPALAAENDFGYHATDPRGMACPLGSHVRRANPRDALEPRPGTEQSLAINRRHRLLRRGRSYGSAERGGETGLYFMCLNANLARQYEFVQHSWLNNPTFNGLYDEPDPVVGPRRAKGTYFTTPARPVRRRYADLPQFVHVRGGAYFFLPGIRALRYLAERPHRPTTGRD